MEEKRSLFGRFTKKEFSWIMYDWANSVYATNMLAVLFPLYFGMVCKANGADNLVLWSYGTSIATFLVAVLAPILGSLADHKGYKKKLFTAFMLIGVIFTSISAIFDNYQMLLVSYVVSHIGFSGANLFYDSFLTDVTSSKRMDKVSTWGYAMGYIGGSTIAFLISIAILFVVGFEEPFAFKLVVILTSLWWLLFSIPMLKNVKQEHYIDKPTGSLLKSTFSNLGKTAKSIFSQKHLLLFILAYFFYIDGVGTVISVSTSYGSKLGLDSIGMIFALLVTQIVAVPFSILFGKLSEKFGSIKVLMAAVMVYIVVCFVGFFMGFIIEENPGSKDGSPALFTATVLFWSMAFLVGTVQGGIQAISRSYFGKLIPPEHSNEYFGFFDIFGKFAAVIGPFLIAIFSQATGRDSIGIISLLILFVIGLALLFAGRKTFKAAEEKIEAGRISE